MNCRKTVDVAFSRNNYLADNRLQRNNIILVTTSRRLIKVIKEKTWIAILNLNKLGRDRLFVILK